MYVKFDCSVDNLEGLKQKLEYVQSLSNMQKDKKFQKFIQGKCLEVVRKVTEERLTGGTTNDDSIELYKANHKIREFDKGFVLYNDTVIPAIVKGVQNKIENYPNEQFPIALAFEYGVGIIGQNTDNPNSWAYNLQDYNFGWYLPQEVTGEIGVIYGGYKGFEIYRFTASEIEKQLHNWVIEYAKKGKEV